MKKFFLLVSLLLTASLAHGNIINVVIETNFGNIELELYPDQAPVTVANFLSYAEADFYDGLVFHRVMEGFIIQGGGFDPDLNLQSTNAPIINESNNGLSNLRGTIAMARKGDPDYDSATSQFFINLKDNSFGDVPNFDYQSPSVPGYCVFGQITNGLDVLDAIAQTPVGSADSPDYTLPLTNVPIDPVIIYNMTPEPTTLALLAVGALALRRKSKA